MRNSQGYDPRHDDEAYNYSASYPKRRKKWPWVLGITLAAVFALCGIGTLVFGGATKAVVDQVEQEGVSRMADVKLTSCTGNQYGTIDVKYTIKNSGTTARSYLLDIEVVDGSGTRVGSANGFAEDLAPGKTAKGTAIGTLEGKPAKYSCVLREA